MTEFKEKKLAGEILNKYPSKDCPTMKIPDGYKFFKCPFCFTKGFRVNRIQHKFVYNKLDCFQCCWNCIYSEPKCITEIEYNAVEKKVRVILENIRKESI